MPNVLDHAGPALTRAQGNARQDAPAGNAGRAFCPLCGFWRGLAAGAEIGGVGKLPLDYLADFGGKQTLHPLG